MVLSCDYASFTINEYWYSKCAKHFMNFLGINHTKMLDGKYYIHTAAGTLKGHGMHKVTYRIPGRDNI